MFKSFLYLLPFILMPVLADSMPNNTVSGFASGLSISLFLGLLLAKKSGFENAKRSLMISLISEKYKKDNTDAQIVVESFLLFLQQTGLHSTHKRLDTLLTCYNINTMNDKQLNIIIKYLSTLTIDPREMIQSLFRL